MEQSLTSWTDDLPLCAQSGIGISPNEVYKKNGRRTEMHPNEDRSFHFRYGNYLKCLCTHDSVGTKFTVLCKCFNKTSAGMSP